MFDMLIIVSLQIVIQFLFWHWKSSRIVVYPVQEILFDRGSPFSINLSREVFLFAETLVAKLIAKSRDFGGDNKVFDEVSRNKDSSKLLCKHYIARQHRCPTYANRGINRRQHHLKNKRRI